MKIYCATGNPGKLREFRLAAELLNIDVEPLPGLKSIIAPEESGSTFEENARLKAAYYSAFAPGPLFADDSGLEVDALHGEPGVFSARFAGENADAAANNALLLARLGNEANRKARFVCVIALAEAGVAKDSFRGEAGGVILPEAHGTGGFGYDPLFYYAPFKCTFSEMDEAQKFAVSHRGAAFRRMLQYLTDAPSP